MPYSPRWSAATLVTMAASARVTRQAAAQDAAAGELQHGDLDPRVAQGEARPARAGIVALSRISSPTRTQSLELSPATLPAARAMAASRRTVVDLPLVPVTRITGTSWTAGQSTSSGAGSSSSCQDSEPGPRPTETRRSPWMQATPRAPRPRRPGPSARDRGRRRSRAGSRQPPIPAAAAAPPASSAAAASHAHSLTSVAAIEAVQRRGRTARLAPPTKRRVASGRVGPADRLQHRARPGRAKRRSAPSSRPRGQVASSTAPGPSSRRLGPVRRRESRHASPGRRLGHARL